MVHFKGALALLSLALLSQVVNSEVLIKSKKFNLAHDESNGELVLTPKENKRSDKSEKQFSVRLGTLLPETLRGEMSKPELTNAGFSIHFDKQARVDIEHPFPECTRFTWTTTTLNEIRDCVEYGTAQWFGGPEQYEQLWPVQKLNKTNYPMVTKSADNMAVADRFWISSEGTYIFVDPDVPLFIDSNTAENPNQLCFITRSVDPYYDISELILRYTVCNFDDVRSAQIHAVVNMLGYPDAVPDDLMFRHPIWSTWARYKRDINETTVLQFAQEILDNGFNNSQLEIDDDWETCYGELEFNLAKFPNPKGLVDTLHQLGFRVTLWVHPFINSNCPLYQVALQNGYFVRNLQGDPHTEWWNGQDAAIIDVTNPAARTWWADRLINLKNQVGLDGYKFDAGEAGGGYLPQLPLLQNAVTQSDYSFAYSEFINGILPSIGSAVEIRSIYKNQKAPIFLRMIDKDTRWGFNNGLRSVVTTLLQMNIVGYPMVLADMIGGNGYGSDQVTPELFIRWLQASTFMPSLQFSYVPWQFNDPTVVEISKKFVDLHFNYSDEIISAAQEATLGGLPINTPICFAVPDGVIDDRACAVDDEYMLGRRILVAPVLDLNATTRDVYLPQGFWLDMNTEQLYEGPILIVNYPAPLDTLPYFRKENIANASVNVVPTLFLLAAALISSLYFK